MTDLNTAVRRLFYVQNVPIELVAKRHNMTIQQVQNIISNPNQKVMNQPKTKGGRPGIRNKQFDSKVKTLDKRGLTLSEIAAIMDCSTSTVSRSLGTPWTKSAKTKTNNKVKTESVKVQSKTPKDKRTSTVSILWGAFTYTKTN